MPEMCILVSIQVWDVAYVSRRLRESHGCEKQFLVGNTCQL